MYSNNILNLQESTKILNALKKRMETYRIHLVHKDGFGIKLPMVVDMLYKKERQTERKKKKKERNKERKTRCIPRNLC